MTRPALFPLLPRLPLEEKFRAAAASGQVVLVRPQDIPALVRLNPANDDIHRASNDPKRDPAFPPYLSIDTGTEHYFLTLDRTLRIAGSATVYPKEDCDNALSIFQISVHEAERRKGQAGKIFAGLTEFFNSIPDLSGVYLSSYEDMGKKYLPRHVRAMAKQLACPVYQYNREVSTHVQIPVWR